MEFPSVGSQCCHENCKQLDFLPYVCSCSKTFCLEHFSHHSLSCQVKDNIVSELKTIDNVLTCSEEGCNERGIVPLICQNCKKHFCVRHRHIGECKRKTEEEFLAAREKLAIPSRQFNEAKANTDKEISKSIENAKKNEKKRKLACKIQLMRLKGRAVGLKSIPTTDRLHFNIVLPSKSEKAVFISKTWTLGKAIDAIAQECSLQNNNNKSGELKLRLFKTDKTILSKVMSDSILDLLHKESIIDGETLIIEYVSDDCVLLD
ncbi:AN1-type zinc finger protein 1-like [Coccinella septempunctata]|uniref:AN1-type zinc finger protein 1-like n=1 Tax=Coccinella septempunctata TaxID=41139 RepID=UPI001D05F08B|nr:AN1-type zinc finger protein 1-like [Coccinella septempunctata]